MSNKATDKKHAEATARTDARIAEEAARIDARIAAEISASGPDGIRGMLEATKTTRDVSELIEAAKKKWDPANLLYGIAMALISSDKLDKSIDISDLDFLETPIVRRDSDCLVIPMVRKNGEPVNIFISVFTLGPVRGMLTAILLCNKVFWTAEVPSRLFEWRNGRHGFIRTLIDKEAAREREITKMKTEFEAAALKEPAEQPATASEPSTQFEDITTEAWAQELAEEIAKEGGYKTKPAAMRVELGLFPDAAIGLVSTDSAFTLAIVVLLDGKISTYEILSADKATEPVAEASTHHQPMVVRCSSGGVIVTLNYRSKHFKDHIHARMTFLKLNKELVDEVDCLNLKTIYQVPATFLGKNALSLVIPEEVDVFYNRLGMLVLTLMRQHRLGRMVVEYVASLDPHTPHHITPKGKMAFSYWLEDTDEKIQLVLESEVKASGDCVILTVTQNGDEYTFMIYAVGCDRAWFVEKFAELQKRCSQQDVMRVRDGKEPKYIHTYRTSYEFQNAIPEDGMYGDFGKPIPIATRWKSKTHRLDTDQTIVEISEAFEKIRLLNDCPADDFKILTVSDYHDTVKVVLLTPYVRSIYLKKVCPCATKDVYNMVQIVASQLIGEIDEIKESIAAEEADEGGREMEEGRAKTNAVELTRAALSTTDEFYLPFFKAVMQNLANYETLATWGVSPYSIVSVNTSHGKTVSLQGVLSNGQLVKPAIVIEDIQAIWRDCIEVTVSLGPNEEYKAYLRTSRLDGWASETIVKHLSKFHGLPSKKTVQEEELKEPMSLTETLNHIDDSMFLVSFAASVLGFLVKDKGGVEGALPKNMPVINNVVCAYLLPWPGVSFACTGNKLPQTDTAPGVYFIVMRVWQEETELHIEGHHTAKGLFKAVLGFKDTDQVRDMVARYKTIEAGLKKTPGKEKLYQLNSLPGVPMNGILGFRVDAAAASEPEAASIPPAAVINSAILPREAVYGHRSDKTDAFVFVLMNAIVHSLAAQPTHPESAIFAGFKSFDKVEWRVDKNYDVYVTLISSPVGDKPLTLICLSLGAVEQVTNNLIAENIFGINICLDDKTSLRAYFKSSSGWIAASLSQAIDNISNMASTEGEHVKVQQGERPPVKAIVFELCSRTDTGFYAKLVFGPDVPRRVTVMVDEASTSDFNKNLIRHSQADHPSYNRPPVEIKEIPAQMSHAAFIGSSSRAISDGVGFVSSFVSSVATALVAEERGNETILQFMQVSHEYLPDSKKLRFGYESLGRPKVQFNVVGTKKDNLDQDVLVMIEMVATGEGKVLRYSPNAAWTETQLFDAFQTVMESCKKKSQLQALGDYMQKQGGGSMDQPGLNRPRSLKDVFTESFAAHRPSAPPVPETQVAPVSASSVPFIGWVNPNKEAVVDEMRKTLLKALSKALKKNASNYSVSASGPLMAFRENGGPESTRDQFAVVLINRKTDTEVWAPLGYTTEGMVVVHPESDAPWFTVGKKLENLLTVYMGSYYITAK